MIREKGGNAMWKSLSDECPGDLRRAVGRPPAIHLDGFTRTDCAVCGHWLQWPFGLVRHEQDGHVIWHVKIPAYNPQHTNAGVLTSMLVDGKAQPA